MSDNTNVEKLQADLQRALEDRGVAERVAEQYRDIAIRNNEVAERSLIRSQVLEEALTEIRQLAGLEGPPTSLSLAIYDIACAALGLSDEEGEGRVACPYNDPNCSCLKDSDDKEPCDYCKQKGREWTPECEDNR